MPKKSSRNTRLRIWLLERDIALRTVAEALGVSRQRLSYIVNAPTITPQMHKRICDIGIPGDLLPPVAPRKYGPDKMQGTPCPHHATAV